MKGMVRKAGVGRGIAEMVASAALVMVLSLDAHSQVQSPDLEKLVKYAQCIRANGYPEFPDPAPDGRMQLKLDPKSGNRFEAAQRACKDKAPPGMAAADQPMTPERMQKLLAFAACLRDRGVKDFPDPSPTGVFEITGSGPDLQAPQVRQVVESCVESHPPGALQIRRIQSR